MSKIAGADSNTRKVAMKVPVASREDVPRPPPGWRKPIPLAIKLQVIINQRGVSSDGTPLDALDVGIHFDHRPPLHERVYDAELDETVPPANDIAFIVALPIPQHRDISARDLSRMCKTDRQRAAELRFRERVQQKQSGEKLEKKGKIRGRSLRKDPARNGFA